MAYDVNAGLSYEQRSVLLEEAAREGWIGMFYHDADRSFARIVRDGRRFGLEEVALIEAS
jgi:hypothetical protein